MALMTVDTMANVAAESAVAEKISGAIKNGGGLSLEQASQFAAEMGQARLDKWQGQAQGSTGMTEVINDGSDMMAFAKMLSGKKSWEEVKVGDLTEGQVDAAIRFFEVVDGHFADAGKSIPEEIQTFEERLDDAKEDHMKVRDDDMT